MKTLNPFSISTFSISPSMTHCQFPWKFIDSMNWGWNCKCHCAKIVHRLRNLNEKDGAGVKRIHRKIESSCHKREREALTHETFIAQESSCAHLSRKSSPAHRVGNSGSSQPDWPNYINIFNTKSTRLLIGSKHVTRIRPDYYLGYPTQPNEPVPTPKPQSVYPPHNGRTPIRIVVTGENQTTQSSERSDPIWQSLWFSNLDRTGKPCSQPKSAKSRAPNFPNQKLEKTALNLKRRERWMSRWGRSRFGGFRGGAQLRLQELNFDGRGYVNGDRVKNEKETSESEKARLGFLKFLCYYYYFFIYM